TTSKCPDVMNPISMSSPQPPLAADGHTAEDEPVFQAPWEAKAFAIVNQLAVDRQYSWTEWNDQLVQEIATAESSATDSRTYYECWLQACEKLLIAKGLLDAHAIDQKVVALAQEIAADHDHLNHDHA
ncbi:MAG: nitrile hydratase accessory protein, partial [Cyanobacteria bacterium P01_A01_bin.70]